MLLEAGILPALPLATHVILLKTCSQAKNNFTCEAAIIALFKIIQPVKPLQIHHCRDAVDYNGCFLPICIPSLPQYQGAVQGLSIVLRQLYTLISGCLRKENRANVGPTRSHDIIVSLLG